MLLSQDSEETRYNGATLGNIGIMEKNMETTTL